MATAGELVRQAREISKSTGQSEISTLREISLKETGTTAGDEVRLTRRASSATISQPQTQQQTQPQAPTTPQTPSSTAPTSNIVSASTEQKQSSITQSSITTKEKVGDTFFNKFFGRGQYQKEAPIQPKPFKKTPFTILSTEEKKKELKAAAQAGLLVGALITPIPGDEILVGAGITGRTATIAKFGLGTARFGQGLVRATAIATGTTESVKGVGRLTAPQEQRNIIENEGFRNVLGSSIVAESKGIKEKGIARSIAGAIDPLRLIGGVGSKESFREEAIKQFQAQGLSGEQLQTAVKAAERQRAFSYAGTGVGIFAANVQSELLGQKFLSNAFKTITRVPAKEAAGTIFKKAFVQIGKAGVIEGVASEAATQTGRSEKLNLKSLGIAGAIGGVSAGLIGGSIASLRVGKPFLSKTIETASYIVDPFEKPADIVAAGIQKGFSIPVSTPVILDTRTFDTITLTTEEESKKIKPSPMPQDVIISQPQTQQQTPVLDQAKQNIFGTKRKGGGKGSRAPAFPTFTATTTAQTPISTPAEIFAPAKTPTQVPATPKAPTMTPTFTPVNIPEFTPVQPTVPVNVPTITNVPAFTPVNVPVNVPFPRIPPPLPLTFPMGSGGRGSGFGFGKRFVNELQVGSALLGQLSRFPKKESVGSLLFGATAPKYTPPKRKGKKRKQKAPFNPMELILG